MFARLLDTAKGSTGHWSIQPDLAPGSFISKQNYLASTNILQTTFIHEDGVVSVTDFFDMSPLPKNQQEPRRSILVRKVECVRGSMRLKVEINPRPDYAESKELPHLTPGKVINAHKAHGQDDYDVPGERAVFFQSLRLTHVANGYVFEPEHLEVDVGYWCSPYESMGPDDEIDMFSLDKTRPGTAIAEFGLIEGEPDRYGYEKSCIRRLWVWLCT